MILTAAVGCGTAGHASPARSAGRTAHTVATVTTAPAAVRKAAPAQAAAADADAKPENDPARPQSLPDGLKVLYQTHGVRGPAQLTTLARIPRGTLGVVALCKGPGSIRVHLGTIASMDVACGTPGVYNEIALDGARTSVALSVTASPQNAWALTLGWTSVIDHPAD
ncbi:hypothetical protein [Actinacidiphila acidipaludis]|uniref:Lipoprotein n=1 Tax=Actinacidiphila acidipaludis TaxID=2873382 RepID=A0ABS7QD26_9ACTN|nr:hypothetical protein [Streptomyces acidipaludis]MBY8881064.1 hypothetical protein [Streptomyces acidipaludis]